MSQVQILAPLPADVAQQAERRFSKPATKVRVLSPAPVLFFDLWGRQVSIWQTNLRPHAGEATLAPLSISWQNSNENIVSVDFAPSVSEADAILAQFGYVEPEVAVAA